MARPPGTQAKRLYDDEDELLAPPSSIEGWSASNRGEYQPWIALSHDERTEFRDLLTDLSRDEEGFVGLLDLVLPPLFG
jgi:hypothetical protein